LAVGFRELHYHESCLTVGQLARFRDEAHRLKWDPNVPKDKKKALKKRMKQAKAGKLLPPIVNESTAISEEKKRIKQARRNEKKKVLKKIKSSKSGKTPVYDEGEDDAEAAEAEKSLVGDDDEEDVEA